MTSDSKLSPRVTKLAGKGIKGMEHDPPLYHFDVNPDEWESLIADPAGFLRKLGLGEEHG